MVEFDVIPDCPEHEFCALVWIDLRDWDFWSGRDNDYIATGCEMVDETVVSVVVNLKALFER